MRRILFFLLALSWIGISPLWGQEDPPSDVFDLGFRVLPASLETRLDDNVYRSVDASRIRTDLVYSLDAGGGLQSSWRDWKGSVLYRLGGDLYQSYSDIDNLKNEWDLGLSLAPKDWEFSYKKEYFLRNSDDLDFDYFDDDNLGGVRWTPPGEWSAGVRFKSFSRRYLNDLASIRSRNFKDVGGQWEVRRELESRFSIDLSGGYTNRQFNRYAVGVTGGSLANLPFLHVDETWNLHVGAHFYLGSVLQDVTLEGLRTDSNSYGFSNGAGSASWAAVLSPADNFYLQLFFRLYSKKYDVDPLTLPNLQVGFLDEDSQDVLSAKGTWEASPDWTFNLGLSRFRNESTQPNLYYIKNLVVLQVQRSF